MLSSEYFNSLYFFNKKGSLFVYCDIMHYFLLNAGYFIYREPFQDKKIFASPNVFQFQLTKMETDLITQKCNNIFQFKRHLGRKLNEKWKK